MAIAIRSHSQISYPICHLRVKDIDFATNQIVIRDGKGRKDRVTMLPAAAKAALIAHLARAREQHQADLRHGAGWVELPNALWWPPRASKAASAPRAPPLESPFDADLA